MVNETSQSTCDNVMKTKNSLCTSLLYFLLFFYNFMRKIEMKLPVSSMKKIKTRLLRRRHKVNYLDVPAIACTEFFYKPLLHTDHETKIERATKIMFLHFAKNHRHLTYSYRAKCFFATSWPSSSVWFPSGACIEQLCPPPFRILILLCPRWLWNKQKRD